MNRLSIRLNKEAHKKAATIVYTDPRQKLPYFMERDEMLKAREQAREKVKQRNAYNEQVKADLGIEFEFAYLGLRASEYDKDWYGDTWEVTGKGDFKITFRQGVGNRDCFESTHYYPRHITAFIVPPSTMDILHCIRLDDPRDESFENWCMEYGYDTDSRKAERIYRACIDQTMMFRRNFPGVDLDAYEPLDNF